MTRRWPLFAFLALLVVPVVEVLIILRVGQAIGGWQTFGILVLWSLVGAWIVKREWSTAWGALTGALRTGRMPARELSDAGLVLIGGALLLAPGFLTDALGLLLILPFTRPVFRGLLQAAVTRRLLGRGGPAVVPHGTTFTATPVDEQRSRFRRHRADEAIIEGEIVDE